MKFFSLLVFALGLLAAASPMPSSDTTEVVVRDTDPNTSVVPLTVFALLQTLEVAVAGLTPALLAIITSSGPAGPLPTSSFVSLLDQLTDALNSASTQLSTNVSEDIGANDEDLANLILALKKLVPKLGASTGSSFPWTPPSPVCSQVWTRRSSPASLRLSSILHTNDAETMSKLSDYSCVKS